MTKNIIKKKMYREKKQQARLLQGFDLTKEYKAKDFFTIANSIPSLNSFGVNLK